MSFTEKQFEEFVDVLLESLQTVLKKRYREDVVYEVMEEFKELVTKVAKEKVGE